MPAPTDELYIDQGYLQKLNVEMVWEVLGYTGKGNIIGLFDSGVDFTHSELDAQKDTTKTIVGTNITHDDPWNTSNSAHGTATASLIVAERDGDGMVGVAYGSKLTSVNIFDPDDTTGAYLNTALNAQDRFAVTNHSWNYVNFFQVQSNNGAAAGSFTGVEDGIDAGRGGLGTIMVRTAGNFDEKGHMADSDGLNAHRGNIVVGAVDKDGVVADYSNRAGSIFVVAEGGDATQGVLVADWKGNKGGGEYSTGDYADHVSGTSFAAPQVAGVASLLLEANPLLGWRDVQFILANTAVHTGSDIGAGIAGEEENPWMFNAIETWNGGGLHYSQDYGFGQVDAYAAALVAEDLVKVRAAQKSSNEQTASVVNDDGGTNFSFGEMTSKSITIDLNIASHILVEHMAFDLTDYLSDVGNSTGLIHIYAISPEGTKISLFDSAKGDGQYISGTNSLDFFNENIRLSSRGWYGEDAFGIWQFVIDSTGDATPTDLASVKAVVYGADDLLNNTYVYTEEYFDTIALDGTRDNIDYVSPNANSILFSAMKEAVDVDLVAGEITLNDGVSDVVIDIEAGVVVNKVAGGDGGFTFNGFNTTEYAWGGRGIDDLKGQGGNDFLYGDAGNDAITGGTGNDTIDGGAGIDAADYSDATSGVTVNLATLTAQAVGGGLGSDTLTSIENLLGSNFGDILYGDGSNNSINGLLGDDVFFVNNAGADVYLGDGGADTINYTGVTSGVTVDLATGTVSGHLNVTGDTVTGIENVVGTAFGDTIAGNTSDNILDGGALNDTLIGDEGNDTLLGGSGSDVMAGGKGDDTYVVDVATDDVNELSGEGTDHVKSAVTYILEADLEKLTLTGTTTNGTGNNADNDIIGSSGVNILKGLGGNDFLNGMAGKDTFEGGTGDDTYIIDTTTEVITELLEEGTDSVEASVTYALGTEIENLTLTGAAAINGTGNALNNKITGNSGSNVLIGGAGADDLDGGDGTDTLSYAGSTAVVVSLAANTVSGGDASGDIIKNFENVTGTAGDDTIEGNAGDNILDGGAGTGDTVSYASSTTGVTLSLATTTTFQNTVGAGNDKITGFENLIGSAFNDVLTGSTAANTLTSGKGNDTLDGGSGTDTLIGGEGDDTYVNITGDSIVELSGEGSDTIKSSVTFTLSIANVENLTLTGTTAVNGTGNALDNKIVGNSVANTLTGLGGNDHLDGDAGKDTLIGGIGDDTYVVDDAADLVTELAGEGTDTVRSFVSYTLDNNVERLDLLGEAETSGIGNDLDNIIVGNNANNFLHGGAADAGNDTLVGGLGDDLYFIFFTWHDNDVIIEQAGEGEDSVLTASDYTLPDNVENLYWDSWGGSAQLTGNALNNEIMGGSSSGYIYVLSGLGGDDVLRSYSDTTTLIGGTGDDTYLLYLGSGPIIELADEGVDVVYALISHTLAANVENLTFGDYTDPINGTGNAFGNIIKGNSAANLISGLGGNDTLKGEAGSDRLVGGEGDDKLTGGTQSDTFSIAGNFGHDTITDFVAGPASADVIEFGSSLFADFAAVLAATSQIGANTVITFDASNTVTLQNVTLTNLHQDDFTFL